MTKSGNYAKKLLAVSAGVALLGGIALTGFAGTDLFKASAEGEDPNKLNLETIDEFATHGYKIEEANADNDSDANPFDSAENPYDYIITVVDKTSSWWNPRDGKLYFEENSHEAVWNITTQSGKKVTGGGAYKWSKIYTSTSTDPSIGAFTENNNEKIIYPDTGDRAENGSDWKCGETVMTFTFKEGSGNNTCTTHGERVPCTCWIDGDGQGEVLTGKYLRVLYKVVHVEDHEFSFTGASVFDEDNPNVMFLNFGSDVLGVSTADESWNHAQRFMSTTLPFFQKIYFLEKGTYDITAEGAVAPTAEQLAGNDLYSLMTGENNKADGLLFETHLRHDHIELGLLAREGADSQEGSKVNYKAGDAFYLAEGLEMIGKDGNTNWCIASEGGSKNILAGNQLFWFDGESWSSDEFSVTLTIDKTKAKAEVDGATDTIAATLVTGKLASEAGELTVTWTSSDEAVATVENGVVTGVSAGTAIITASLENGSTKTCTVTVVNADEITGIKLNKSNNFTVYTSGENNTFQLTATVEGGSKAPQTVTWTIADNTIATVDENGLVTGLKAGSTKITCTAADGTTTATVNVNVKEAAVVNPDDGDDKNDDDNKGDENKGGSGCNSAVSGSILGIGAALIAAGTVVLALRKKNGNK